VQKIDATEDSLSEDELAALIHKCKKLKKLKLFLFFLLASLFKHSFKFPKILKHFSTSLSFFI
jgi:hypothetical protein